MKRIKNLTLIVMALVLAPLCFESPEIAGGGELQRVEEPEAGDQETTLEAAADEAKPDGETEVIEPVAPNDDGDGKSEQQV